MTFSSRLVGALLSVALLSPAYAGTQSQELESIFAVIENHYAPLTHKESLFNFKWEELKTKYVSHNSTLSTSNEFYFQLAELFNELKDAHVSVSLPSSYHKALPLQFSHTEGRTILSYSSEDAAAGCSASIGDELVAIDGETPDQIRSRLSKVSSVGNERTDLTYLTLMLTSRNEARGVSVSYEKNQVSRLEFKRLSDGTLFDCQLTWSAQGAPIIDRPLLPVFNPGNFSPLAGNQWAQPLDTASASHLSSLNLEHPLVKKAGRILKLQHRLASVMMDAELSKTSGAKPGKALGQPTELGSKKPFFALPHDFKPLKTNLLASPLVSNTGPFAGTFEHQGMKVGYLRIPSYVPTMLETAIFGVRFTIARLEKETDFLIIDQTNNPGGYVAFSDWIVASLTGTLSEDHMKFAVKPTQDFLRQYADILADLETQVGAAETDGTRALGEQIIPLLQEDFLKIKEAYEQRKALSEPIRLHLFSEYVEKLLDEAYEGLFAGLLKKHGKLVFGEDLSSRAVYTKPVYMMINELDFSGGDATPAVLQDYGRVKLLGVNTAGAGGSVGEFSHAMDHQLKFRLTQSLMIRKGGALVENFGVKPDLAFETTLNDHLDGFASYFGRALDLIFSDHSKSGK